MLLHLMERVGAAAGETLMIGDTTHDLELARNAGAAAVAVAYGAHAADGLCAASRRSRRCIRSPELAAVAARERG